MTTPSEPEPLSGPRASGSRLLRRYACAIVHYPLPILVGLVFVTGLAAIEARQLRLASRLADQAPQHHPNTMIWNAIRERFGLEQTGLVALRARAGDVFTPELLAEIRRLTRDIEQMPEVVPNSVLSLASPRLKRIERVGDNIDIRPLLDSIPDSPSELERLRQDVLSNDLYKNLVVSTDGSAAAIVAEFSNDAPSRVTQERLAQIAATANNERSETFLAGPVVMNAYIERYSSRIAWLIPITILIIALVHYEAFRTIQAMALPLVTAIVSLILCLGIMGWLGYPVDPWTAVTPIIILAIAAGHAVQMLKRYYEEFARCGDSRRAVVDALVGIGPVMLTAGGIAAAGFASLATFGVQSVRVCGILLASGVLSALVVEMTMIPAVRALLPAPKRRDPSDHRARSLAAMGVQRLSEVVLRRPRATLLVAVLTASGVGLGITRIVVSDSYRDAFYPSSRPRIDEEAVNTMFGGTVTLHLLVEGDAPGSLEEPEVLRAVEDVETFLRDTPEIGKVVSYADFVLDMHKAMSDSTGVPTRRKLVAQYLLLYAMDLGPQELGWLLDSAHQHALVAAFSRTDDAERGTHLLTRLRDYARRRFSGLPARMRVGAGALGMHAAATEVIVREKLLNMAQVALVIFVLASIALRSLVGGLLVLTPLVIAVMVNLGVMGWLGTPLGVATAAVTAMGVSLGADFAIYLLCRIGESCRCGMSIPTSVRTALGTAGEAICFVSSAIIAGYLALTMAGFRIWTHVGGLTALMIASSALATLTVVPALVLWLRPSFLQRMRDATQEHLAESSGGVSRETAGGQGPGSSGW